MTAAATDAQGADAVGWYHTLDLPGGVTTPGLVDCRPAVSRTLIPPRLDGQRVLDVGTWDGFWAFELERRGGAVTTLDLPDPDELGLAAADPAGPPRAGAARSASSWCGWARGSRSRARRSDPRWSG